MAVATLAVNDASTNQSLFNETLDRDVAQVILRSALMGRRIFRAPTDPTTAQAALSAYLAWVPPLLTMIEDGCRASALGTRYEEQVRAAVMSRLGVHPHIGKEELFGEFAAESE
jgi:hypothetical protein